MTRVFLREHLTAEDVAQVSVAVVALDLDSLPVCIRDFFHGSGNGVVERGPATVRVEFVRRAVELGVAALADVRPLFDEVVILAAERRFGSFVLDDVSFFFGEFVEGGHGPIVRL